MYRYLLALLLAPWAAAQNPFFIFDNGTGRDDKVPLEQQADMVKRAGYDGIGFTGTQRIPEFLQLLDARGLKMFSTYIGSHVDHDPPDFDAGLAEAIRQLKGRDTVIWLNVQGKASSDDPAVALVRKIADMAAESGLKVVLYPHVGFYVERIQDALRIREKANRPNVRVSFNMAHFLAIGDEPKLDQTLKEAMPYLEFVSINGADHEGDWRSGDWSRLIQTLDRGSFDVRGLLAKLRALGYKGPVGLQCYHVAGNIEENMKRSMAAWKAMGAGSK